VSLTDRLKSLLARRRPKTADTKSQDAAAAVGGIVASSAGATATADPPRRREGHSGDEGFARNGAQSRVLLNRDAALLAADTTAAVVTSF
jgi:hypothetical protein